VAAVTLWLGWTIFYGSWVVLVATFLLWLVLNHIVIPREERGLESRHQEAYRQYFREVRRWL
jgi:protein-S-isoprenylcysteine O-methyltransferase Ste14